MQRVSEVMTRDVRFVSPQENIQRAAQLMNELNVGVLPVCDGDRLVGMVTDRDITVRATASGRAPNEAHVDEVMSTDVNWCFEDQPLDEVMQQMADSKIRRIPVVAHDESHKLVGIVALGDLVTKAGDGQQRDEVEQVVDRVSSPSHPNRSGQQDRADNGTESAAGSAVRTGSSLKSGTSPHSDDSDVVSALTDNISAAAGAAAAGGTGLGSAATADDMRLPGGASTGGSVSAGMGGAKGVAASAGGADPSSSAFGGGNTDMSSAGKKP